MIQTSCPHCRTGYRLPDTQLGKHVRCKSCKAVFPVEEEPPVLEEASDEDLHGAQRRPSSLVEELPVLQDIVDEPRRITSAPPPPPVRRRYEEDRPVRRHYEDEDDRPSRREERDYRREPAQASGSGAMLVILGACAALFLLIAVGGGLAYYFTSASPPKDDQANNSPTGSGKPAPIGDPGAGIPRDGGAGDPGGEIKPPVDVIPPPKSVDAALTLLKDPRPEARRASLEYLARVPESEHDAKRDVIGPTITPFLEDRELWKDALAVLGNWHCKEAIPKLTEQLADDNIAVWGKAAKTLGEIKEDEAAEALAKQLGVKGRAFVVRDALVEQGNRAEKYVLGYLHHPDSGARREAASLLKRYGTTASAIMEQTVTDLSSAEKETSKSALETLARVKAVSKKHQETIGKALEGLMTDTDAKVRRRAINVFTLWATEDNVATLNNALKDPDAKVREGVLTILARLKSEQSIEPVALHLFSLPREQEKVVEILLAYGSKAEKPVQNQLTNGNANTRRLACLLLAEIGTSESLMILLKFGQAELKNGVRLNADAAVLARKKIKLREEEKKKEKDKGL